MNLGPEPQKIKTLFSQIADRYDLANSVLSAGIHLVWKNRLIKWSGAKPGDQVLDCATGTGDLAFLFEKAVSPNGSVMGTDFCAPMLDQARIKASLNKSQVVFLECDATDLAPINTQDFDVCSIAFGIRNVQNPQKAIAEMHRVLKPGGVLMVLEFGQPKMPVFKTIYRFYSNQILPRVGGLLARGNKKAYDYLNTSAAEFPCRENFVKLMRSSASFSNVEFEELSGGIAYLYKAIKN
jgi:demethylmenaquinone methyltransferase/2-methoxy-6-polyprenyl-1,4-benzoquinol methylase